MCVHKFVIFLSLIYLYFHFSQYNVFYLFSDTYFSIFLSLFNPSTKQFVYLFPFVARKKTKSIVFVVISNEKYHTRYWTNFLCASLAQIPKREIENLANRLCGDKASTAPNPTRLTHVIAHTHKRKPTYKLISISKRVWACVQIACAAGASVDAKKLTQIPDSQFNLLTTSSWLIRWVMQPESR